MASLESQIMDARRKAELFARRLDVARKQEEDNSAAQLQPAIAPPQSQPTLQSQWHSLLKQQDVGGTSTLPPLPPSAAAILAPSSSSSSSSASGTTVASLELLVKAQQRDLVKADTDLRVSSARNRSLQQRVEELEKQLREAEEALRQQGLQGRLWGLGGDAALHESQMQVLKSSEYARSLEMRLEASELRCRELSSRLAVSEAKVRNSLGAGSIEGPLLSSVRDDFRFTQWTEDAAVHKSLSFTTMAGTGEAAADKSTIKTTASSSILVDEDSLQPPASSKEPVVAPAGKKIKKTKTAAAVLVSKTGTVIPRRPASAPVAARQQQPAKDGAARRSITLKVVVPDSGAPKKKTVVSSPKREVSASHELLNLSLDSAAQPHIKATSKSNATKAKTRSR
jgi:hypothetical protein